MLILTRKSEQGIVIAGEVTVRVLSIDGERVKIGIDAPRAISVLREELIQEVEGENRDAVIRPFSRGLIEQLRTIKTQKRAG